MSFRVGQLDSTDAAEVVEEAADLVVRRVGRELSLSDEKIGLSDIASGEVVSEEENSDCRLSVRVLAQN